MVWTLHPSNVGTDLPLEGLRVLDFSRVLAGPLCAMVVGDLGADVIKVEGPEGDPVRSLAPPYLGDDATYYLAVNRHRRNVVADLKNPEDFARVANLVREADAVVENFLPDQIRSLGIDRLRELNPNVVWVSVTPASGEGALRARPSFDLLAQARSGLMGVTGEAGGPPTKVGAPIADVVTGLFAAVALVSGLLARVRDRPGRRFEAPLLESAMSALVNQAQGFLSTGVNPARLGNQHPSIAPYGPVPSADGFVMLAVGTDHQYQKLVTLLGDEHLAAREDWRTNDGRVRDRDALLATLAELFRRRPSEAWFTALDESGVPFSPIYDVAGAFAQSQIAEGDFVGLMDTPAGPTRTTRTPLLVDGVRPTVRRGPRRLGEDNDEIFGVDAAD